MTPEQLGRKYDKIAQWWQEQHDHGEYGLKQLERALRLHGKTPTASLANTPAASALDVGCGAGGRFIRRLVERGFAVTGLDVSKEMINRARKTHPTQTFIHEDICRWVSDDTFDFILGWDSLFHLPLVQQEDVLKKLCNALNPGGTLLYTFGNALGDHEDQWRNDTFYYSSIGIAGNLQLLLDQGLSINHLELDQYPERHVYIIATRPAVSSAGTGYDAPRP